MGQYINPKPQEPSLNLEEKSGYCGCLALSRLTELGRRASDLEARCDTLNSSLDLEHPFYKDRKKLLEYGQEAIMLHHAVNDYYRELEIQTKIGNLKIQTLPDDITIINCASCNQQIDIVDITAQCQ